MRESCMKSFWDWDHLQDISSVLECNSEGRRWSKNFSNLMVSLVPLGSALLWLPRTPVGRRECINLNHVLLKTFQAALFVVFLRTSPLIFGTIWYLWTSPQLFIAERWRTEKLDREAPAVSDARVNSARLGLNQSFRANSGGQEIMIFWPILSSEIHRDLTLRPSQASPTGVAPPVIWGLWRSSD